MVRAFKIARLMTILITNDDGIGYPGIKALVKAVKGLDELIIVAPRSETSAAGKALTFSVEVDEVRFNVDGKKIKAYTVSGTPADAVIIALTQILDEKPRLILSGINGGGNLGIEEFFTSATIGAVIEGALHGVPGIAFSLVLKEIRRKYQVGIEDFKYAMKIAKILVKSVLEHGFPKPYNILVVNIPEGKPRGVKVTRLAKYVYGVIHEPSENGRLMWLTSWRMDLYESRDPESDITAIKEGYVSITPINIWDISKPHVNEKLNLIVDKLNTLLQD